MTGEAAGPEVASTTVAVTGPPAPPRTKVGVGVSQVTVGAVASIMTVTVFCEPAAAPVLAGV